jgi:hypothetical protein
VARSSDEEALVLREKGHTFAAIARNLGFKRAGDARVAFLQALRKREGAEREQVTRRESERLNELETRIRDRDAADPEKMERRLAALEKMREALR